MIRHTTLFLGIAMATIIQLVIGFIAGNIAVSVVPGWHTPILSPYSILSICKLIWIWLLPLLYLGLRKKNITIPNLVAMLHLLCTLAYFVSYEGSTIAARTQFEIIAAILPNTVFAAGQITFLAFIAKAWKAK